jgi:hypothetical protein
MPGRKAPDDWKPRTIALLRRAVECGGVRRAAGHLGEKRQQLIEDTIMLAERTELELMRAGTWVSYNDSCRVAADHLEGVASP